MPSGSVSGFKSWHNGSPINSSSWANPNTIACGSSGYVGAVRFSISQSASSITISSSVYRRLSTGTMRAEIRTSELSNHQRQRVHRPLRLGQHVGELCCRRRVYAHV